MKNFESLADALDDLRKRGYQADFEPQSDCLYCNNLDLRLYEEDFTLMKSTALKEILILMIML